MRRQRKAPTSVALVESNSLLMPTDQAAGLGALVAMLAANLARMTDAGEDEVAEGTLLATLLDEDPALGSSMLLAYTRSLLGVSEETARLILRRLGTAIEFVMSTQDALGI